MRILLPNRRYTLILAVVLVALTALALVVSAKRKSGDNQSAAQTTPVLRTESFVPSLSITGIETVWRGGIGHVYIVVQNNSHKAVQAFTLAMGEGALISGALDGPPAILPFDTTRVRYASSVEHMIAADGDKPVVLSAAAFADGSREGKVGAIEELDETLADILAKRASSQR